MRMVAEEIVKEAERNQPQICANFRRSGRHKKIKRGAWLHRALSLSVV
jgi:hypothetical protein